MGGPVLFVGRHPRAAHGHVFITSELFDRRHHLLDEALHEARVPEHLRSEWLRIDAGFRRVLVKARVEECAPRFKGDAVLMAPHRP